MSKTISAIGIVGAGRMGRTIALACAKVQLRVVLLSRRPYRVVKEQLGSRLQVHLDSESKAEEILDFINITDSYDPLLDADLIIECVPEDLNVKKNALVVLDHGCSRSAIFASNTSSLSIAELAAFTGRKDRFVGLHFLNPADVLPLVEIVFLPNTSSEVTEAITSFVRLLGKEFVVVQDSPGFLVNRILFAMMCEAMHLLASGIASMQDIDKAMRLGASQTLGPFALADMIGLDVCHDILTNLATRLGDRFAPPGMLSALVKSGRIGRKVGAGFFTYEAPIPRIETREGLQDM